MTMTSKSIQRVDVKYFPTMVSGTAFDFCYLIILNIIARMLLMKLGRMKYTCLVYFL